MDDPKRTFTTLFLIGAAILIIGLFIIWYPDSVISGLKEQINHATLSSQKAALERTLYSENLNRVTYYQPISVVLVTVGSLVITYSIISTLFKLAFKTSNEEKNAGLPSVVEDSAGTSKEADVDSSVKQDLGLVPQKADLDIKKKSADTKKDLKSAPPKTDVDFMKKSVDAKIGTKKAATKSNTKQNVKKTPKKADLDIKKKSEDTKRGTKKAATKSASKKRLKSVPQKADVDFKKKIEDMKKSLKSDDNSE